MSCQPNTPSAKDVRTSGFVSTTAQLEQSAPTQWWPVASEVLTLPLVAEFSLQSAVIRQLVLRETASSAANIKKQDIRIVLYSVSGTTVPTGGAVYEPSPTNRVGIIDVVAADYKRVSSTEWEAVPTINGGEGLWYQTAQSASSTDLYAVLLYSNASPSAYANSTAAIALNVFVELAQVT